MGKCADVAQPVEHGFRKAGVEGSSPSIGFGQSAGHIRADKIVLALAGGVNYGYNLRSKASDIE